ncbi:DNA repair protein SWI5 homolog [Excalfactoria chinensis]|uniref:DNA repair protein SWI5 homolog n=1 Tax=Excalfactoria chinensis TaxID=46218 RepID=UPI003B3B7084
MSAPRPGHVSRRGERRVLRAGSAPRPAPPRGLAVPLRPAPPGRARCPRSCPAERTSGSGVPRAVLAVLLEAAALAERSGPHSGREAPPAQRRALGGRRRSVGAGFRSPLPARVADGAAPCGDGVEALKEKDRALDREIAQLLSEGYNVEELEKHISLLHEYNEIKDAGQMLLGKLAVIRGVTTKQLYPEYDLELSD